VTLTPRCILYRRAKAKRQQRKAARLNRAYQVLKAGLYDAYVYAPTYTEARRILTDIMLLSIEEERNRLI
jgi:hypothetical protein